MPYLCPIVPEFNRFSHEETMQVCQAILDLPERADVLLDLKNADDATTSGFARLVLLRKVLRADGRDLFLVNLRSRVAQLYHVNRLEAVLPHIDQPN